MAAPVGAILQAVTAALNTVGTAIKAQAAVLAGQLSVNQSGTAYHQAVDVAGFNQSLEAQKQRTVIIAVVVIAVVLFLLVILFVKV